MASEKESFKNSGFGSNPGHFSKRLINKDGSYNVNRSGVNWSDRYTIFHLLVNTSWPKFFLATIIYYTAVNVIFGLLYLFAGYEQVTGVEDGSMFFKFIQLFFFSSQTMTTVGYGHMSPVGLGAEIIAFFEAFVGLLSFALISGLFYAKISKPRIKVKFSRNALISPYREGKALMFRMASGMKANLGEARVRVLLSKVEEDNVRKFYNLKLEMNKIFMFVTSWTVVHPIDDSSPIHGYSDEDLASCDAEILIHLSAYDETHAIEITTRHSYKFNEMVSNAKFAKIHDINQEGAASIAIEKLSEYQKLD